MLPFKINELVFKAILMLTHHQHNFYESSYNEYLTSLVEPLILRSKAGFVVECLESRAAQDAVGPSAIRQPVVRTGLHGSALNFTPTIHVSMATRA